MSVPSPNSLTIVSLLPALLDTNGDAGNARVLAQRSRWAGIDADVVEVNDLGDLPERADLVVIGSGTDADLEKTLDALQELSPAIRAWQEGSVPILAVGTGWELLSTGVDLTSGGSVRGLGLVPGRASALPARATDDIVVDGAGSLGNPLVGFENHTRGYTGAPDTLGRVTSGTGNGDGTEGLVAGSVIGTHLHGPVLARNPALADRMLAAAHTARGLVPAESAHTRVVDGIAHAARAQVLLRLGLPV
jgi:CobQ-like glutamine amidotransferase family enzyme